MYTIGFPYSFLSKLPSGLTAVRELSSSSPSSVCIEGNGVWLSNLSRPDGPKYCIAIKDISCGTQMKLYLEGQAAMGEFNPKTAFGQVFAYRGILSQNEEFETQTEDCEVTLTIDGSDPQMCCIFIHKWSYVQMEASHPTAFVTSLPDPLGSVHVMEHANADSSSGATEAGPSDSGNKADTSHLPHHRHPSLSRDMSPPCTSASNQGIKRDCSPHTPSNTKRVNTTPSRSQFRTSTSIRDRSPHRLPGPSTCMGVTAAPVRTQGSSHGKHPSGNKSPPYSSTADLSTTRDCPPPCIHPGPSTSSMVTAAHPRAQGSKYASSKPQPQYVYTYTELAGLTDLAHDARVNVAGVVKNFRSSYHSRGTDYCCTFSLVDQTFSDGVTCIVFSKYEEKLPRITRVGEIVVIRRVKVNFFNGCPQLIGISYSSFHVFDGETSTEVQPRRSSQAASLSDKEREMVKSLQEMVTASTELNSQAHICVLEKAEPALHFDIIAQVVSVVTISDEQCVCLTVCDGTKFPLCSSKYSTQCFQTQAVLDKTLVKKYNSWTVDILIYESCTAKLTGVVPGCFVYLHDIYASPLYGKDSKGKQCVVTELSAQRIDCPDFSCAVLDLDDRDVVTVQSRLLALSQDNKRNPGNDVVRCLLPSVTTCLHPDRPFTSVADVLVCSQVPNMFRCDLRAVRIFPSEITGLVRLCCQRCGFEVPLPSSTEEENSGTFQTTGSVCPKCAVSCSAEELSYSEPRTKSFSEIEKELMYASGRAGEAEEGTDKQPIPPLLAYTYVFKLVLEDDSGSLEAFVAERDANLFLESLPPANLRFSFQSRSALWQRLRYLFGQNPFDLSSSAAVAPRMDCCVLSYYASSSEASSEEVAFRICRTILPAPPDN